MAGLGFGQRCEVEHVVFGKAVGRVDSGDAEYAFRKGSGLIEDNCTELGQGFQIIAALDQDALAGCGTDAAEKGQRNGNDQCAGAGNDEEDKGAGQPVGPETAEEERRNQPEEQRAEDDKRRVVPAEPGNEPLRRRFAAGSILYEVDDFAGCRFSEGMADFDFDDSVFGNASGQGGIATMNAAGHRFSCKGFRIEERTSSRDLAIQRNPFTGMDDDCRAYGNRIGCYGDFFAILPDMGDVGTDIHETGNRMAGPVYGQVLEPFTNLIKKHDGNGFRVFSDAKGTDGRNTHEEMFIKNLATGDIAQCLPEDIIAQDEVSCYEPGQVCRIRKGIDGLKNHDGYIHDGAGSQTDDAAACSFFFFAGRRSGFIFFLHFYIGFMCMHD